MSKASMKRYYEKIKRDPERLAQLRESRRISQYNRVHGLARTKRKKPYIMIVRLVNDEYIKNKYGV